VGAWEGFSDTPDSESDFSKLVSEAGFRRISAYRGLYLDFNVKFAGSIERATSKGLVLGFANAAPKGVRQQPIYILGLAVYLNESLTPILLWMH